MPLFAGALLLGSCNKNESTTDASSNVTENSNTVSMVQDSKTLKNEAGETITISYFAKGNDVAVKLKKGNEPERELIGKATSENGNPLFTDGTYVWEMSDDGTNGILTDKNGSVKYSE